MCPECDVTVGSIAGDRAAQRLGRGPERASHADGLRSIQVLVDTPDKGQCESPRQEVLHWQ